MVDYSVAKAGVISLTKSLAKELAHSGINVNAVSKHYQNRAYNESG